jgi:glutaredoxin
MFLSLVAFSVPFLVNFIFIGTDPDKYQKPLDLDLLYKFSPAPSVELRTGKHIIAFMSLTCPHCKKAAYLLHIIHDEHPDIPIFLVLNGTDTFKQKFFDETHAEHVPYLYYHHSEEFMKLAGPGVPAIFWVNNGIAEYKSTYAYYQLDPAYMEQWLKAPALKAPKP